MRQQTLRKAFLAVGFLLVVLEVVDAFRIEETVFALVFAGLLGLALAWTWASRYGGAVGGPILAILLALMELMGLFLFYPPPKSMFEWVDYSVFGVLSAAVVLLGATLLWGGRAARKGAAAA